MYISSDVRQRVDESIIYRETKSW